VDPVTLIVTAVALGASAGLTEAASTAVRGHVRGVEDLAHRAAGRCVGVERKPDSAAQRAALREALTDAAGATDDEVLAAAQRVTDAVATDAPDAARVVGVMLRDVQGGVPPDRSVTSTGDGLTVEQARFTGGIDIGDVHAGEQGRARQSLGAASPARVCRVPTGHPFTVCGGSWRRRRRSGGTRSC
jgi:hypothetical protein